VSIVKKWHSLSPSNRFLISYPIWFLTLFGIFYWGKYWDYSIIGKVVDSTIRDIIMAILELFVNEPIVNYDIIMNPKYHIVITPECNGLIPYFILLAAILAYPCSIKRKLLWLISTFFIFFIANIIRLITVIEVVRRFGAESFYYIHDIGGNIFLVAVGSILFLRYLKGCYEN